MNEWMNEWIFNLLTNKTAGWLIASPSLVGFNTDFPLKFSQLSAAINDSKNWLIQSPTKSECAENSSINNLWILSESVNNFASLLSK